MKIGRRPRLSLPRDVGARLALEPGERPLAWALLQDDQWIVGSDRAFYLPTEAGDTTYRRLGWEDIERADWQRESSTLGVVEVTGWGQPERRTPLQVAQAGKLLELLRERVTKSVLVTVYSPVHGRRGVSVVGRRSPIGTGEVTWSYVLADGLDPDDLEVSEVAERALAEAQIELAGL